MFRDIVFFYLAELAILRAGVRTPAPLLYTLLMENLVYSVGLSGELRETTGVRTISILRGAPLSNPPLRRHAWKSRRRFAESSDIFFAPSISNVPLTGTTRFIRPLLPGPDLQIFAKFHVEKNQIPIGTVCSLGRFDPGTKKRCPLYPTAIAYISQFTTKGADIW